MSARHRDDNNLRPKAPEMINNVEERVVGWAHQQAEQYRQGHDRPLAGYLGTLGIYTGGVIASALGLRLAGRRMPERIGAGDLALLTVATHRLSRTIAKDPITSPFRAPFTSYRGQAAAAELKEEVRGHGLQHSLGELVSCPMCLAQWVATGFTLGMVAAPRPTRLVMATLSAVAGADFMQYVYSYLQQATEK